MPNSKDYLLADLPRVLFPLNTTKVLVMSCSDMLLEYARQKALNRDEEEHGFLPQTRCYSAKSGLHLRRSVKLDPVAELFIYDLVHRNRQTFRRDFNNNRRSYGYGFRNGLPKPVTEGYSQFRHDVLDALAQYRFAAKFDVAGYFNSVYHHDLVGWFSEGGRSGEDAEALGQFLREANAGRSLDCLPQGIHPCKMIGAEFLKFVDNSALVQSELLLRLMDDFYLFSDDEDTLLSDFVEIQQMLGEKGLSLNAQKTQIGNIQELHIAEEVDDIKASLLQARRNIIAASGGEEEDDDEDEYYEELSEEQIEYLLDLLKNPDIDEADAELVLVMLRDHGGEAVLEQLGSFLHRFPSLARNVYNYCGHVEDRTELAALLLNFVRDARHATEYQLFWITKAVEDHLSETPSYRDLIPGLYDHAHATEITRAKLLEIPDHRFGLPELRRTRLRAAESSWSSWAAAVGCRNETRVSRNHLLGYFRNGSQMNRLVADCVRALPGTE